VFISTEQQLRFIEKASSESVLTACPGSGKTHTAVLRFIERSKATKESGVAFVSFTNVAVDEAVTKVREYGAGGLVGHPNVICTLDAFFRNFIFDPFIRASLPAMPPDLEVFEKRAPTEIATDGAFDIYGVRPAKAGANKIPLKAWEASGFLDPDGSIAYDYQKSTFSEDRERIDAAFNKAIGKAKRVYIQRGFATFNDILLCCRALLLAKERRIAQIVARRFAEIIVDEAQDTSMLQQSLLQAIAAAGSKISYVGDQKQGIYLFNKANPKYLEHLACTSHEKHELSDNFRSISEIVEVVNKHFGTSMKAIRAKTHSAHGAYLFIGSAEDAVVVFEQFVDQCEIKRSDAAVVVRKRKHLEKVLRPQDTGGWRAAPRFAMHAWQSERRGELEGALRAVVRLIRAVLHPDALGLLNESEIKELGWLFLRGTEFPTPDAAETPQQWCSRLKVALEDYLKSKNLSKHDSFAQRTASNGLPKTGSALQAFSFVRPALRTTVVHQVKGETISAVLVVAPDDQHDCWLSQATDEEESNVCYVAFTRAADVLVLHCPSESYAAQWRKRGFVDLSREAGVGSSQSPCP
jgi:superfamily I DNA/RNA helicase